LLKLSASALLSTSVWAFAVHSMWFHSGRTHTPYRLPISSALSCAIIAIISFQTFLSPQKKPVPVSSHLQFCRHAAGPGDHLPILWLWICLTWTLHKKGVMQHLHLMSAAFTSRMFCVHCEALM
jgi:hypothetical protein